MLVIAKTTLHRDGTVTYWSAHQQRWERHTAWISDEDLAALPSEDRGRVIKQLGIERRGHA